jgi:hypothetical protein
LNAAWQSPDKFIMNVDGLVIGRSSSLESTTDLTSGVWTTETNFLATQAAAFFTNSTLTGAKRFFRVIEN